MTRLKICSILFDGGSEFGKSFSLIAYCQEHGFVREPVAGYTHAQNARAEGAIRICKEHVSCLLRSANLPPRFWPDALRRFCRLYAYWPDGHGLSAWEKLDSLDPHEVRHNLLQHLHVFGSYVTVHLPREHAHVIDDTTHDDRAEE